MRADHFQSWRREREAIEQKMDCLIAEGLPTSVEERQVRRMRFAALIEQREAAARKLLELARTSRRDKSSKEEWVAGDQFISATRAGGAAESEHATFQVMVVTSPFEFDAHPADRASPAIDAVMSAADRTNVNSDHAAVPNSLPEYAVEPATDVAPHGTEAAAFANDSAAAPIAALTADTAVALWAEVAHGSDAAALGAGFAAAPVAAPVADAAAASQAERPHHQNAAALLTGSAAALATSLAADATRPTDIVPQAPDAETLPPDAANTTIPRVSTKEANSSHAVRYNLNPAALTESASTPAARTGAEGRAVVSDTSHAATFPDDAAVVISLGLSKEDAKPTDGVARAAAALPTHLTAIPADAAATSKAEVGHDPDAAATDSDSAVMPTASPSAKIAQHSSDVSALNRAASPVGLPAESTKIPDDIVLLAHSVSIPAATVPDRLVRMVPDPLLPMDRTKTHDVHSDRSLLKLLQRLQSKLSRGGNEPSR
jgi:hypothetical protein